MADFFDLKALLQLPLGPAFFPGPNRRPAPPGSTLEATAKGSVEAVHESMSSLLMKYIPSLGCVLLAYHPPPRFVGPDRSRSTSIPKAIPTLPGSAWGFLTVELDLLGWRPSIGQVLSGRPSHASPSHLSLVVYQTFNASIPSHHLKPAGYYFDPNLELPKSCLDNHHHQDSSSDSNSLSFHRCRGAWVDSLGNIVGGSQGIVQFTVISLTIANNMISIVGSLLPNPLDSLTSSSSTSKSTST